MHKNLYFQQSVLVIVNMNVVLCSTYIKLQGNILFSFSGGQLLIVYLDIMNYLAGG